MINETLNTFIEHQEKLNKLTQDIFVGLFEHQQTLHNWLTFLNVWLIILSILVVGLAFYVFVRFNGVLQDMMMDYLKEKERKK